MPQESIIKIPGVVLDNGKATFTIKLPTNETHSYILSGEVFERVIGLSDLSVDERAHYRRSFEDRDAHIITANDTIRQIEDLHRKLPAGMLVEIAARAVAFVELKSAQRDAVLNKISQVAEQIVSTPEIENTKAA